jgi:hypothetical protein
MATNTITLESLVILAKNYQTDLKYLPYLVLRERLAALGITFYQQDDKEDSVITFLRKRGILAPYSKDQTISYKEIGKTVESVLRLETSYASLQDDIKSYEEKKIVPSKGSIANNKTKEHPYQTMIMAEKIKTYGEDIMDCLFPGVRNKNGHSPLDAFDGFDKKIDTAIAAGLISIENGNFFDCGDLNAPTSDADTSAFDHLVDFLRYNKRLRGPVDLRITPETLNNAKDACENKYSHRGNDVDFLAKLKDKSGLQNLSIISDASMGAGDRIHLSVPGNFDFGFNNLSDTEFVQIRNPWENPNLIQFWMQSDQGTRIRSFHEKVFLINAGTNTATEMSGDYVS